MFHPVAQCTAGTALPAQYNVSNERALNNKLSDKQELLLYPVCLPFSAIELDVDSALHATQWNVQLLGSVILFDVCVLSAEGICIILHFVHSSHAWVSGCLLVVRASLLPLSKALRHIHAHFTDIMYYTFTNWCWISTGATKIIVFFLSRVRHSACSIFTVPISWIMVQHASHAKITLHCVIQCLIMFLVGLLPLNWLYSDMTFSQCPLMVVWQYS